MFKGALIGAVGLIASNEIRYAASQIAIRRTKALEARIHAEAAGKPLLVAGGPLAIGGPHQVFLRWWSPHEPGDVCLDLDPSACPPDSEFTKADVRDIPFPDMHFGAALASHILEHMPSATDAATAYRELERVAGKVFIAGPRKNSLCAHCTSRDFHPLWVWEEDGNVYFEER